MRKLIIPILLMILVCSCSRMLSPRGAYSYPGDWSLGNGLYDGKYFYFGDSTVLIVSKYGTVFSPDTIIDEDTTKICTLAEYSVINNNIVKINTLWSTLGFKNFRVDYEESSSVGDSAGIRIVFPNLPYAVLIGLAEIGALDHSFNWSGNFLSDSIINVGIGDGIEKCCYLFGCFVPQTQSLYSPFTFYMGLPNVFRLGGYTIEDRFIIKKGYVATISFPDVNENTFAKLCLRNELILWDEKNNALDWRGMPLDKYQFGKHRPKHSTMLTEKELKQLFDKEMQKWQELWEKIGLRYKALSISAYGK